jgi:hypothetical protein
VDQEVEEVEEVKEREAKAKSRFLASLGMTGGWCAVRSGGAQFVRVVRSSFGWCAVRSVVRSSFGGAFLRAGLGSDDV